MASEGDLQPLDANNFGLPGDLFALGFIFLQAKHDHILDVLMTSS